MRAAPGGIPIDQSVYGLCWLGLRGSNLGGGKRGNVNLAWEGPDDNKSRALFLRRSTDNGTPFVAIQNA
jgi:hypothetical protein